MQHLVLAFVLVLAAGSPAASAGDVESFFGIGGGPVGTDGKLAERFSGGGGGRVRFGFRLGRLGAELQIAAMGIGTTTELESPFMFSYRPSATVYAIASRRFQLLGRAGLGFGGISGARRIEVPCEIVDECTSKPGREGVSYPGMSIDAGVTAQLHLGRSISHVMLWLDVGGSFTRHQIEGVTTTGRTHELVIGIARAFR